MDTRQLAVRRVEQGRRDGSAYTFACIFFTGLVGIILYLQQQPSQAPVAIVEHVRPLQPIGEALAAARPSVEAAPDALAVSTATKSAGRQPEPRRAPEEHESMQPMAVLNRERARVSRALGCLKQQDRLRTE